MKGAFSVLHAAEVLLMSPSLLLQGSGMGRQDTGWSHHLHGSINPISLLDMPAALELGIRYSGYGEMYHESFLPGLPPRTGILSEQAMAFSV